MEFHISQQVQTTVDAPALTEGDFAAPAGTLGTISGLPLPDGTSYGVLLDGDPDALPASYEPQELIAAPSREDASMSQRRDYLNTVNTVMAQAGFGPASYSPLTGHAQAWYQWTGGQYAVNADAWPAGLYVIWHHARGWHYSTGRDTGVRHPLPFTLFADPMDVADGVRRLLLGLVRDLPASTDDWQPAAALAVIQDGPQ
ncbi:hypothetical protein GCM10009837_07420 [Streptomyces durmitorensis]|uniref:DUF317 domain-containing protein n=1 Tax=Streptomyces durmitorensis TaxID=319947 RepID=A0ABY4PMT5_9ACTN|nr:hypothetical protein [Streptomyces durmitorensis]UQT54366.1 hypothetical protein M4V62_04285 [Streptomyces durmitorensis]